MADHRSRTEPVTFFQALPAAIGDVQRLFSGPEGRRTWRRLAWTAIMAGAVGVGVQPPPIGLLHPVWSDPSSRETALTSIRSALPQLVLLGSALFGFALWARSYSLALVDALLSASDRSAVSKRYRAAGAGHFLWSTAITFPLYALLFAMEAVSTQASWERLLQAGDAEAFRILAQALIGFLAVLFPWVVLTLPVMVFQYELVPVVMVRHGSGPLQAAGAALRAIGVAPGRFVAYFGGRIVLQLIGAGLMTVVAIPSLLLSAVLASPLIGGGWALTAAAGGWGTGPGAAVGSVTVLLGCAAFYCVTCAALLPLTAFPFFLADRVLGSD